MPELVSNPLEFVRALCIAMDNVEERMSHGEPAWFIKGKRLFAMFADRHHDDRIAVWCAARPGIQEAITAESPTQFFRPPYVGPKGWIGIYLDVPQDADELEALLAEAYNTVK